MEKPKKLLNKEVQFTGIRIHKGNPVTGILTKIDSDGITVKLTKDIEGINNCWFTGKEKHFPFWSFQNIKAK